MRYASKETLAPYAAALRRYMGGYVETIRALYLDKAGAIVQSVDITLPGATSINAEIDTRLFLRCLYESGAVAVVIAHNHPNGEHRASAKDKSMVRNLAAVCAWLGVTVRGNLLFYGPGLSGWHDIRTEKKV